MADSHVSLLELFSSCWIHDGPRIQSLPRVLAREPVLMYTGHSGHTWIPQGCLLFCLHVCAPCCSLKLQPSKLQHMLLFIFGTSERVELQISPFGFSKERKILQYKVVPQNKENSSLCYALLVASNFSKVISY